LKEHVQIGAGTIGKEIGILLREKRLRVRNDTNPEKGGERLRNAGVLIPLAIRESIIVQEEKITGIWCGGIRKKTLPESQ